MDSPSCVMLKHEDWPGAGKRFHALRNFQKDGSLRELSILVGNGGLFLDFEMERGRRRRDERATALSPELLIDVGKAFEDRQGAMAAHDLFRRASCPLIRYEQAARPPGSRCANYGPCKSAA